jgi:hypothetical protein
MHSRERAEILISLLGRGAKVHVCEGDLRAV